MNTNDMISKIKEVLNLSEEVKLEQMPLENGTVLEAESFEAGNEVFIVTEDEKVAVPVGEYELEDGRILVVAEEGIIAEIKAEEEEEVEVEAKEEEKEYATKEELAEVKSMIEEIKAMLELEPKEEMSEEPKEEVELSEVSNEVPNEVQEELDKPAAEPIKANPEKKQTLSKFNIASNRPMSTLDKIMAKLSN
jgi:outer membrane biosynthesis protein TonB